MCLTSGSGHLPPRSRRLYYKFAAESENRSAASGKVMDRSDAISTHSGQRCLAEARREKLKTRFERDKSGRVERQRKEHAISRPNSTSAQQ